MDAKDIKSELEALQRLYELLKCDGDGVSKTASDILDGNARLVLKNLLDAATQRALKAHAELIAARLESPSSVSPSQMLQSNDLSKEQPVPQQHIATTSDVSESFGTDQGSEQKRKLEQSIIQNMSACGPEYLKKRCRVCKRSTIKNQTERSLWKSEQEPESVTDIGEIYSCDDETPNEPKETDYLSKEASEAIKEIELCISALQLGANHLFLFEKRSFQHRNAVPGTNSGNPCLRTQPGALLRVEPSQFINVPKDHGTHELISEEICFPYNLSNKSFDLVQPINGELHLTTQQFTRKIGQSWGSSIPDELRESIEERPIQKVNQNRGQKVKAIIEKIESGKWKTSYGNFVTRQTRNAQNLISAPSEMESPDKSPMAAMNNKRSGHVIFPLHKHSNNSGMKLMITNGNVPDWRGRGTKSPPSNSRGITVLNKNRKYESESTASSSSYSSNSNSQQNSTYYGIDSEEYSFPRRTHRLRYVTPSTSTNSAASPPSSEIESKYGSSISNSEDDEVYSSTSNGSREVTSSIGSKTEGYSTDEQSIHSRNHKPANGINRTKKQSATWKRLKERLAIIFHHHHHHHHHHNNNENGHHKGKSFLSRRESEAYGEKAVEKTRKSVVHDKKRQNHFHGIMEAVLRHVRHSKKSKSVDKMVPLDKVQHGNKKLSQKSQWWKLLQHQRRAKLPNKAHVKIGVGKKKPRLKALPTIK